MSVIEYNPCEGCDGYECSQVTKHLCEKQPTYYIVCNGVYHEIPRWLYRVLK
jgi:hypothetical protein